MDLMTRVKSEKRIGFAKNIIGILCLGRLYDENGNLRDWWEEATKEEYLRRSKCIVDQYSNYFVEQAGLNIKGKQTQGENIADNGGIKIAYEAYCEYHIHTYLCYSQNQEAYF